MPASSAKLMANSTITSKDSPIHHLHFIPNLSKLIEDLEPEPGLIDFFAYLVVTHQTCQLILASFGVLVEWVVEE